jgi:hypothetical protein
MTVKILIGELLNVAEHTVDGDLRTVANSIINKLENGFEYPMDQIFEFLNYSQQRMI